MAISTQYEIEHSTAIDVLPINASTDFKRFSPSTVTPASQHKPANIHPPLQCNKSKP
jgi:hypothetical protein